MSEKNTEAGNAEQPEKQAVDLSVLAGLTFGPRWTNPSTPKRREWSEDRPSRPYSKPQGEWRRQGAKEDRRPREREQRDFQRRDPVYRPSFEVLFYPEDEPFNVLLKAMRSSCRTYELFEVSRLILEKNDRFVVVVRHLKSGQTSKEGSKRFYLSGVDGAPFET